MTDIETRIEQIAQVIAQFDDAQVPRNIRICLLYTSPSPRDISGSRMPSSA